MPIDQVYSNVIVDPKRKNNDQGIFEVSKGQGIVL